MTRNGQRLLMLIDDEPAQRRLVAALAARRGWRAVFAQDGEMAIAMLGTQDGMQLDAILLDHWAPEADASALIAEIRERRPALPLLMLTANGSVAQAVGAMRAGATDFLVKPLAPERLLAALDAAVTGKTSGELRPLTEKSRLCSRSTRSSARHLISAPRSPSPPRQRERVSRCCSKAKAASARKSSPKRSMPPPRAARSR